MAISLFMHETIAAILIIFATIVPSRENKIKSIKNSQLLLSSDVFPNVL
jgi:hypothetical protein